MLLQRMEKRRPPLVPRYSATDDAGEALNAEAEMPWARCCKGTRPVLPRQLPVHSDERVAWRAWRESLLRIRAVARR